MMSMASAMFVALGFAQATPAASPFVIESDSACPSAQAVRDALASLRPSDDLPHARVSLQAREQTLVIVLGAPRTGFREVPVGADCAVRASTAALVLATWLDDLPAAVVGSPILAPPAQADALSRVLPLEGAVESEHRREIGAGLLAAMGGGFAPGVRVEVGGLMGRGVVGWQVGIVLPAGRDVKVGAGTSSFARTSASVSLLGRVVTRKLVLTGDAGPALAYTRARGQGYAVNQSDQSLTYGLVVGGRGAVPWRRFRFWIDARLFEWLYGQKVEVEGAAATALPSWDVQCAVGTSYAF